MGVTIPFEGQLNGETGYQDLIDIAVQFAREQGWPLEHFSKPVVKLLRVKDEKDRDYQGPVKGIVIRPHSNPGRRPSLAAH